MMLQRDKAGVLKNAHVLNQLPARERMIPNHFPFLGRQLPRLAQNAVRYGELPQIVQQDSTPDVGNFRRRHPHRFRYAGSVVSATNRMVAGVHFP